jgi:hypothetical protein
MNTSYKSWNLRLRRLLIRTGSGAIRVELNISDVTWRGLTHAVLIRRLFRQVLGV